MTSSVQSVDGIVHQFPCCGQEAHRECAIQCPSCDAIQFEGASLADEEECILCSTELSPRDRFVVPCCQHALHLECLVHSFESCGIRCPFCQIEKSTLASSPQFQQILGRLWSLTNPFQTQFTSRLFHHHEIDLGCLLPQSGADFRIWRIDACMEWSLEPGASGGPVNFPVGVFDLFPDRPGGRPAIAPFPWFQLDSGGSGHDRCPTCVHFQIRRKKIGSRVDLYAACLHCVVGMQATLSRLGEGTHSGCFRWRPPSTFLFDNWSSCSSPRVPTPVLVSQRRLIDACAAQFVSLPRNDPLVAALTQSQVWGPSGDHLDARLQEQCTLPHVLSMMEVWISAQVAGSTIPPPAPTVVDTNFHNGSSGSFADNAGAPSRPLPSLFVPSRTFPEVPPRSPFESQASRCMVQW